MGDEAFPGVVAADVVGAEDGQALRLEGDLEVVLGDDDGVGVEGVRAEQLGVEREHAGLVGELLAGGVAQRGRHPGTDGYGGALLREQQRHVVADLDGGQVGGHRVADAVVPGRTGAGGLPRHERAVDGDDVRVVGGDDDLVQRLLVRGVVAGEPAGCAVGLRGDERAVLQFLPAEGAPRRADGPRRAGVADGQGELRVDGDLLREGDAELPAGLAEAGDADFDTRGALRGDPLDPQ